MTTRMQVFLPDDLVSALDQAAGKRRRSRFVEEAIREKLAREAQGDALRQSAGVLNPDAYPEWATPERTSAWVAEQRGGAVECWSGFGMYDCRVAWEPGVPAVELAWTSTS